MAEAGIGMLARKYRHNKFFNEDKVSEVTRRIRKNVLLHMSMSSPQKQEMFS